jgi:predicted ArsR family transcriptional regulator
MNDRELSDQAIAVLVDVARTAGRDLNAGQRLELDRLVSDGLVAVSHSGDPAGQRHYRLTVAGQTALDKRGVGANEA